VVKSCFEVFDEVKMVQFSILPVFRKPLCNFFSVCPLREGFEKLKHFNSRSIVDGFEH
jgi:hypothetical protein